MRIKEFGHLDISEIFMIRGHLFLTVMLFMVRLSIQGCSN